MNDDSDRKRRWLADYLDALPDHLRTTPQDPKLLDAARVAYGNGWSPRRIATAVAMRSYDGVLFPSKIAIGRLAEIGATAPRIPSNARRCGCGDPDCATRATLPEQWVRDRWALIRELHRTPGMGEDEREHCMATLIAAQQQEAW